MLRSLAHSRAAWLAAGLLGGLVLAGLWPKTPLHAVATDRIETFAMATGPLDDEVEAVYFLDFLTGDLRALALNRQSGKFTAFFEANVLAQMGVDPSKNPRFLMVTGVADLRRGAGRVQPSRSACYVAEVTTGKVAAYAIPWNPTTAAGGQVIQQPLIALDVSAFRATAVPPVGLTPR
jgi:hypothetical protein